jgi:hypothetical protein
MDKTLIKLGKHLSPNKLSTPTNEETVHYHQNLKGMTLSHADTLSHHNKQNHYPAAKFPIDGKKERKRFGKLINSTIEDMTEQTVKELTHIRKHNDSNRKQEEIQKNRYHTSELSHSKKHISSNNEQQDIQEQNSESSHVRKHISSDDKQQVMQRKSSESSHVTKQVSSDMKQQDKKNNEPPHVTNHTSNDLKQQGIQPNSVENLHHNDKPGGSIENSLENLNPSIGNQHTHRGEKAAASLPGVNTPKPKSQKHYGDDEELEEKVNNKTSSMQVISVKNNNKAIEQKYNKLSDLSEKKPMLAVLPTKLISFATHNKLKSPVSKNKENIYNYLPSSNNSVISQKFSTANKPNNGNNTQQTSNGIGSTPSAPVLPQPMITPHKSDDINKPYTQNMALNHTNYGMLYNKSGNDMKSLNYIRPMKDTQKISTRKLSGGRMSRHNSRKHFSPWFGNSNISKTAYLQPLSQLRQKQSPMEMLLQFAKGIGADHLISEKGTQRQVIRTSSNMI